MSSETDQERGEILRVFRMLHYNPVTYLGRVVTGCSCLSILSLLVLAVLGSWLNVAVPTPFPDWSWQLFFLTILLLSALANAQNRIVVRTNGLEIHRSFMGSGLFSTWDNLSHLGIREVDTSAGETGGITYHRMLYLKHVSAGHGDAIDIGSIIRIDDLTYTTGRRSHKITHRVIDPDKLVQSPFGHELLTYAPHVIEAAKQEKKKVMDMIQLAEKISSTTLGGR